MPSHPDPIEERAIAEQAARHSGEWTAADERRLENWLAEDSAHRHAWQRVSQLWQMAGALPLRPASNPARHQPHFLRRHAPVFAGLAVMLLLAPLGLHLWYGKTQTVSTRMAQQKTIDLPDGTSIMLDADSELTFQFGYGQRRATLARGEAFFTVQHDARRPFEVIAGSGRIVDLGTRFDVDIRNGVVNVAVLEGKVGISHAKGETELIAGQGAGYDAGGAITPIAAVDDSVAIWREGKRVYRNIPLGEVLQVMHRYLPVSFELTDPALAQLRVSGVFRVTDLHAFLATLQTSFPVHARWLDGRRIELSPVS